MNQFAIFGSSPPLQAAPSRTPQSGQSNGGFSAIMQGLSANPRNNLQVGLQIGAAHMQAPNWSKDMANGQTYLIAQVQDTSASNTAPSGQFADAPGTAGAARPDAELDLTSEGNEQSIFHLLGQDKLDIKIVAATGIAGSIGQADQEPSPDNIRPMQVQALQAAAQHSAKSAALLQPNPLVVTMPTSDAKLVASTEPLAKSGSATGLLPELNEFGKILPADGAINKGRPVVSASPENAKTAMKVDAGPEAAPPTRRPVLVSGGPGEAMTSTAMPKISNSFSLQSQHPGDPTAGPRTVSANLAANPQNPIAAFSERTAPPRTNMERVSRSFETARTMTLETDGRVASHTVATDTPMIVDEHPKARPGAISTDFASMKSAVHQTAKSLELRKPEGSLGSAANRLSMEFQLPLTSSASAPLIDQITAPLSNPDMQKSHPKAVADALLAQVKSADVQEGRTTINLQPRGLGSIEVEMMKEHDVTYKVIVRIENPMVLQMLREERHMLAQMIGISDSDVMSFDDANSGNQASTGNDAGADPVDQIGTDITEPIVKRHQDVVDDGVLDVVT